MAARKGNPPDGFDKNRGNLRKMRRIVSADQGKLGDTAGDGGPGTTLGAGEGPNFDYLIHLSPDVRGSIVRRIRKKLDTGRYNVKAGKIAGKIMKHNLLDGIY